MYWDWLAFAAAADVTPLVTTRLQAARAELRYRGFSRTNYERRDQPEVPVYDAIANVSQRWRDLVGYYTRFGDVRELLERVDDRYVIMNAGDEMQLSFPAPPPPAAGWRRDFVLVGDGWEKDGDYNTSFSQTVQPLPSHDRPDYGAGTASLNLDDDPGVPAACRRLGDVPHPVRHAPRFSEGAEVGAMTGTRVSSAGCVCCGRRCSSRPWEQSWC